MEPVHEVFLSALLHVLLRASGGDFNKHRT